ncbi:hypothetical protein QBC45DRAFT_333685, partial [Copromyces sp. CBS 386.78]
VSQRPICKSLPLHENDTLPSPSRIPPKEFHVPPVTLALDRREMQMCWLNVAPAMMKPSSLYSMPMMYLSREASLSSI